MGADEPEGPKTFNVFGYETQSQPVISAGGDRTTTLRFKSAPPVAVLELAVAECFFPSGQVFLASGPGGALVTPLEQVALALRYLADFPDRVLLVAGHGESRSSERAESARAFVLGERGRWAELAAEGGTVRDWQHALAWIAETFGWPCDPGVVDGLDGRNTQRGLKRFRRAYADERGVDLPTDRAPPAAVWEALFDKYDDALAKTLGVTADDLAARRDRVRRTTPSAVGCEAHWPAERVRIKQHTPARGERVDLLFFEADNLPKLVCHGGGESNWKKCDVYRKAKFRLDQLLALDAPFGAPSAAAAGAAAESGAPFLEDCQLRNVHDEPDEGEAIDAGGGR